MVLHCIPKSNLTSLTWEMETGKARRALVKLHRPIPYVVDYSTDYRNLDDFQKGNQWPLFNWEL